MLAKEAAIKKAAEDMKFYKLELINREQSYNNMFGNNPNVGVMMPPMGGVGGAQMGGGKPVKGVPMQGQRSGVPLPRAQV